MKNDTWIIETEKAVCFTGHRHIPPSEKERLIRLLDRKIESLFSDRFTYFLCGGAIGFDMLAEEAVLRARKRHPEIRLILVLPCEGQSARWKDSDAKRYQSLLSQADDHIFLSPSYYPGCMLTRNRYMVDHSSRCVCFLYSLRGGTMSTVQYAAQKQLPIENLAMDLIRKPDGLLKEEPRWNCTFISRSAKRNAGTAHFHPFQIWTRKWVRMWMR